MNTVTERLRAAVDTADGETPIVEVTGYDEPDIDDRRHLGRLQLGAAGLVFVAAALAALGVTWGAILTLAVGVSLGVAASMNFGVARRAAARRRPPTTGLVLTDRQLLVAKGDDEPLSLPADRVTGFRVSPVSNSFGRSDGGSDVSIETLDGALTVSVNAVSPKTVSTSLVRAVSAGADEPVDGTPADLIPVPPFGQPTIFIAGWLREPTLASVAWLVGGATIALGVLLSTVAPGDEADAVAGDDGGEAARVVVLDDERAGLVPLAGDGDASIASEEAPPSTTAAPEAEPEAVHSGELVDEIAIPDLAPLGCELDMVDEPRVVEGRVIYLQFCGAYAPIDFEGAGDYLTLCVDPRWADRLPGVGSGPVLRCGDDLMAFDPATGDPRWAVAPRSPIVQVRLTADRGVVQLEDAYGVIDTASGAVLWETFHDEAEGRVAVADGQVFEPNDLGIIARNIETGEALWSSEIIDIRSMMADDRFLYVSTDVGLVHALDRTTGSAVHSTALSDPGSLRAVGGGIVAAVSGGNQPTLSLLASDGLTSLGVGSVDATTRVRISDDGTVIATNGRTASISFLNPYTAFSFGLDGAADRWHVAIDGDIVHMGMRNAGGPTPARIRLSLLYENWEAQQ
ncbi:MAG: PQQ-binding-like beta-propeller repeat protein [Actinomycetota bacterium]